MRSFLAALSRRAALLWIASAAGVALAADPGVLPREIVIGQSISLQGGKNAYGVAVLEGVKLQIDAVNAAGGIFGRRIALRVLDDDSSGVVADANARKLVQDGAFVLFGSVEGGPSTAVMKVAAESRVPLFGPLAGPPLLRRPHQAMVFPVRAEHRDEFRALMAYGRTLGMTRVGFFHADTDVGRAHLENVRLIAGELGMTVVVANAFKSDAGDDELDRTVSQMAAAGPELYFNHGSAGLYARLIQKARAAGLKTSFTGVNSGSSQIAKSLGDLAHGMVFSQVVPSPWERKREITREYQDAMRKADPSGEFSYGGLEGFLTAKALVKALQLAGPEPSRASFIRGLETTAIDLGGIALRYSPQSHEGSRFVDLALVTASGRFAH